MTTAYWSGQTGWYGIEILAEALRVVREINLAPAAAKLQVRVAKDRYADDSAMAALRWPRTTPVPPEDWTE